MEKIIDISQWNTIKDWNLIKDNVDAAVIRVGYTYSRTGDICIDKKYPEYRKTCKSKNIPYSLYYTTNSTTVDEAYNEADFVAYECRDLTKYALPVFIDTERIDGLGRADALDVEIRTKCIKAFCDRLQSQNIPAGIYCNTSWLNNQLDKSKLPYSLWLAQWGNNAPSDNCLLWQYTSQGNIPGVLGYVDLSKTLNYNDDRTNIDKLISTAIQEIGYIEKKNGDLNYLYTKDKNIGSNNYTKYGYEMHKLQPSNMDYPAAWCNAFISWIFVKTFGLDKAKRMLYGDIDDYTISSAQRFINANKWFTTPEIGDIIYFKNSLGQICHVGLVQDISNNIVYTIEGNTSSAVGVVANGGCVKEKCYAYNYKLIAGYGRPKYAI